MRPRRRARAALRWALSLLATATLLIAAASTRWSFQIVWFATATPRPNTPPGMPIVANGIDLQRGYLSVGIASADFSDFDPRVTLSRAPIPWAVVYASGWPWRPVFRYRGPFPCGTYVLPLWIPIALTTLPAAFLWLRFFRSRRRNGCPTCHYDLSGLTPATPCPECGSTPPSQLRMSDG